MLAIENEIYQNLDITKLHVHVYHVNSNNATKMFAAEVPL